MKTKKPKRKLERGIERDWTLEINQARSMRLAKSEEEESTIETWTRKREFLLTVTAFLGIGNWVEDFDKLLWITAEAVLQ